MNKNLTKYYNAIRYSLTDQIKYLKVETSSSYNKNEREDYWIILNEFLRMVESWSLEDFKTESELIDWLESISIYLKDSYLKTSKMKTDKASIFKFIELINKNIKSTFDQAHLFPILPYRRVLTEKEWEKIWKIFEQKLKIKEGKGFLTSEDEKFKKIIEFIVDKVDVLYCINPVFYQHSYELSGKWLNEMYSGNDYYWIDKNFEWAIYADGNGYPRIYGEKIGHLLL